MEAIATEPLATGLSLLQRDSRCVWAVRQISIHSDVIDYTIILACLPELGHHTASS
jgi:hypothetical protein